MKSHRTELAVGLVLAVLSATFWAWQTPGSRGKLTEADVDVYIRRMHGKLPATPEREASW